MNSVEHPFANGQLGINRNVSVLATSILGISVFQPTAGFLMVLSWLMWLLTSKRHRTALEVYFIFLPFYGVFILQGNTLQSIALLALFPFLILGQTTRLRRLDFALLAFLLCSFSFLCDKGPGKTSAGLFQDLLSVRYLRPFTDLWLDGTMRLGLACHWVGASLGLLVTLITCLG